MWNNTTTSGGDDGFFGSVSTGLSKGLEQYLPNWVGRQLGDQSFDQLKQDTFNKNLAQSRVNDGMKSTTDSAAQMAVRPNNTWLIVAGVSILLLGAVYVARRA